jgi:hypothetical protein
MDERQKLTQLARRKEAARDALYDAIARSSLSHAEVGRLVGLSKTRVAQIRTERGKS